MIDGVVGSPTVTVATGQPRGCDLLLRACCSRRAKSAERDDSPRRCEHRTRRKLRRLRSRPGVQLQFAALLQDALNADYVLFVVVRQSLNGLADRLLPREMDDACDAMLLHHVSDRTYVEHGSDHQRDIDGPRDWR